MGHSIPEFPVYLFDLDGTLVDSASDICGAIQAMLLSYPEVTASEPYLRSFIGRHLFDLFEELFPAYNRARYDEMLAQYRTIYHGRNHSMTRCYDGVREMLAALPGRKSTATTKGTPMTRMVLEKFELLTYFDHVQGTDGFPAKPEPHVILAALDALGSKPADCLFVGDSTADMEAGRRAGVKTCAVLWGYGERDAMLQGKPDFAIESPAALLPQTAAVVSK